MHFNDPARSLVGDRPAMRNPLTGESYRTALPSIMVSLHGETYSLWAFLPTEHGTSSPKFAQCADLSEVSAGLAEWFANPEDFAVRRMGWVPFNLTVKPKLASSNPPAARTIISADDLEF